MATEKVSAAQEQDKGMAMFCTTNDKKGGENTGAIRTSAGSERCFVMAEFAIALGWMKLLLGLWNGRQNAILRYDLGSGRRLESFQGRHGMIPADK